MFVAFGDFPIKPSLWIHVMDGFWWSHLFDLFCKLLIDKLKEKGLEYLNQSAEPNIKPKYIKFFFL